MFSVYLILSSAGTFLFFTHKRSAFAPNSLVFSLITGYFLFIYRLKKRII